MTSANSTPLDATIQKTNELLKDIEIAFGWENRRSQSYAALRTVLHALRDRLPVEEAIQLGAQLPLLVKGIYFDGWKPSPVPKKIDKEEFLEEIREKFQYSLKGDIKDVIGIVLSSVRKYVSEGEKKDVLSILPKDLNQFLRGYL